LSEIAYLTTANSALTASACNRSIHALPSRCKSKRGSPCLRDRLSLPIPQIRRTHRTRVRQQMARVDVFRHFPRTHPIHRILRFRPIPPRPHRIHRVFRLLRRLQCHAKESLRCARRGRPPHLGPDLVHLVRPVLPPSTVHQDTRPRPVTQVRPATQARLVSQVHRDIRVRPLTQDLSPRRRDIRGAPARRVILACRVTQGRQGMPDPPVNRDRRVNPDPRVIQDLPEDRDRRVPPAIRSPALARAG
jgi:hypothetical protein